MTEHLYTVEKFAEELDEPPEKVERLLKELEEEGIVHKVDDRHWDIHSRRAAMSFLVRNYPSIKMERTKERMMNIFNKSNDDS